MTSSIINSGSQQSLDGVLSHPTTLRIFFYCKKHPDKVNIRQAQRDLAIKSTSTVSWHLEKLAENGLMEQQPDNSYQLTPTGRELSSLQVPLQQVVYFVGNNPVTSQTFLTVFVLTSTIIATILSFISTKSALVHSLLTLIVISGLMIHFQKKLQENNKHLIN
jgi:DNA-binding HxlR family transcriptional regulator